MIDAITAHSSQVALVFDSFIFSSTPFFLL
jgi:hypothetical protein